MTSSVAFLGLGNMGMPMATRLIAAGIDVHGFDLSHVALSRIAGVGGFPAQSANDAVKDAETVILMLPNSEVVESIVMAVLPDARGDALFIDMSSSEPMRTRVLSAMVVAEGKRLIDAPVSGGVKGAVAGTLAIMAGGSDQDYAQAETLLEVLGHPTHVGSIGAGHALKALNNLMSAIHLWGTSEAMLAGIAFGLDPVVMLEVINASSGRSGSTENKWPNFILRGSYDSGFGLRLMLKDMRIATQLAEQVGVRSRLGEEALAHWAHAAEELPMDSDHTRVAEWLRGRP